MGERKPWTKQEDQLLKKLVSANQKKEDDKYKWGEIAELLNQHGNQRTGKQCRERWHNQLKPGIDNDREWTKAEEHTLFRVQQREGNKWALIAKQLPGRTDNNIKNYFYSTLRKALRKVNTYVQMHKKQSHYRNIKEFKQQNLSKILAVAEKKYQNKINLKSQRVENDAQKIKRLLVQIQRDQSIVPSADYDRTLSETVQYILEFNRNCKRRKGKKKDSQNQNQESEEDSASESIKEVKKSRKKIEQEQKPSKRNKQIVEEEQQAQIDPHLQKKKSSFFDSGQNERNLNFSRFFKKQSSSSGLKEGSSCIYGSSLFRSYQAENSQQYINPLLEPRGLLVMDRDTNFLSRIPNLQKHETIRSNLNQIFCMQQHIPAVGMNNNLLWSQGLALPQQNPLKMSLTLQNSAFLSRREQRLQKRNSDKK